MRLLSQTTKTWDTPEEIQQHTRALDRCPACKYTRCSCGGCGPHCTPCTCTPIDVKPWEADSKPTPDPVYLRKIR
jgi:hypothetical protein